MDGLADAVLAKIKSYWIQATLVALGSLFGWAILWEAMKLGASNLGGLLPALFEILKWSPVWAGSLYFVLQNAIFITPRLGHLCLETAQTADFFLGCNKEYGLLHHIGFTSAALVLAALAVHYGKLHLHVRALCTQVLSILLAVVAILATGAAVFLSAAGPDVRADALKLARETWHNATRS
jgi:hypothetical protein